MQARFCEKFTSAGRLWANYQTRLIDVEFFMLLTPYKCLLVGLKNIKQVLLGLQHIIADVIAKDRETLTTMRKM